MSRDLKSAIAPLPLIAILRGISPKETPEVGAALFDAGFRIIEVPLNSPEPYDSIRLLARRYGDRALIGAGTVLAPTEVDRVAEAGGALVVAPNGDAAVVRRARERGLLSLPGFFTPTEAFRMIEAGADGLKFFPAEGASPAALKALKAVLPPGVAVVPTGGIDAGNMKEWREAGAAALGVGGSLYKPGMDLKTLEANAQRLVAAARAP